MILFLFAIIELRAQTPCVLAAICVFFVRKFEITKKTHGMQISKADSESSSQFAPGKLCVWIDLVSTPTFSRGFFAHFGVKIHKRQKKKNLQVLVLPVLLFVFFDLNSNKKIQFPLRTGELWLPW